MVGGAFHLVEDLSHLTHAAVDTILETGGRRGGGARGQAETLGRRSPRADRKYRRVRYLLANMALKLSRTELSFSCRSFRMSAASVSSCNARKGREVGTCQQGCTSSASCHRLTCELPCDTPPPCGQKTCYYIEWL